MAGKVSVLKKGEYRDSSTSVEKTTIFKLKALVTIALWVILAAVLVIAIIYAPTWIFGSVLAALGAGVGGTRYIWEL